MRKILILTMALAVSLLVRAQKVDTLLNAYSDRPIDFSVKVPDGNYRVTVTLGSKKRAAQTVVRAESRRHYTDLVTTKKGQFQTVTFTVNKHEPTIDASTSVKLKPRELSYKNWDEVLNLQFCGPAPAVQRITIEPDSQAVTVFLCGNSTVVDQEQEPWASWGQMITRWFDERVVIANYAEESLVGYRWYDCKQVPVAYPFGFGLSYATFQYSDLKVHITTRKRNGLAMVPGTAIRAI